MKKRRLGYLSGAPRVSTRPHAEATGPRAHVLGVMRGFENLGWQVHPYIVGDRVPESWITSESQKKLRSGRLHRMGADLVRIALAQTNRRRAFNELHTKVDWVYERLGAFQDLGWPFKKHGAVWILETNALLYKELREELKTVALGRVLKRAELKAYHRCDVVVCISEALKSLLIEETNVAADKVVVIPNAADVVRFGELPQPPDQQELRISWVGAMRSWTDLHLLMPAVKNLNSRNIPIHVKLIGDGVERANLEQLVEHLGIRDKVTFVGRVPWDQVQEHVRDTHICFSGQIAIPHARSMYLSPIKIYEYMAMARPVIASAYEDAKRLVIENQTGFLYKPENQNSLTAALHKAFEHRHQLGTMGQTARQLIVDKHSWERRVTDLVQQVEAIIQK